MPDPSSEPEKYTIDEMMDRLKGRDSAGKSELVIRPDGSQAVKTKKRKRRTNQAVNEETKRNQRIHVVQIAAFVVLIVILGLAVGIGVVYANSASFRESLIGKLERASGAKVSLTQFRMNPAEAKSNKAALTWADGYALSSLNLEGLVAKISPACFFGSSFSGEEIISSKGNLILKAPSDSDTKVISPEGSQVNFQRYSVASLDIRFGDAAAKRRIFKGTEVSLYPSSVSSQAEIRMLGGLLEFDAWPAVVLDRSYIKFKGGSLDIQSMRFVIPKATNDKKLDKGFIDFSGVIEPVGAGVTHSLDAEVQDLRLPYLLGADLGRFFVGNVDSQDKPDSNVLKFSPFTPESAILDLNLTNSLDSRIDLGGFRFLGQLAEALDDRWYLFPNFDSNVAMTVRRLSSEVAIDEINMISRGRMALKGSVSNTKEGGISGKISIGLPENMVTSAPNKRLNLLFGEVRDGYRWMDLVVGGTAAVPEDNFKELYLKASTSTTNARDSVERKDNFGELIEGGE